VVSLPVAASKPVLALVNSLAHNSIQASPRPRLANHAVMPVRDVAPSAAARSSPSFPEPTLALNVLMRLVLDRHLLTRAGSGPHIRMPIDHVKGVWHPRGTSAAFLHLVISSPAFISPRFSRSLMRLLSS
jgi:hypothetical protein